MAWIGAIVTFIVGGSYLAYATGVDDVIYRTIMNFAASLFCYLAAKSIDLGFIVIDFLPPLPYSSIEAGLSYFLQILVTANTFFPVMEFVGVLTFMFLFYVALIAWRIVLKLVPGLGG